MSDTVGKIEFSNPMPGGVTVEFKTQNDYRKFVDRVARLENENAALRAQLAEANRRLAIALNREDEFLVYIGQKPNLRTEIFMKHNGPVGPEWQGGEDEKM